MTRPDPDHDLVRECMVENRPRLLAIAEAVAEAVQRVTHPIDLETVTKDAKK